MRRDERCGRSLKTVCRRKKGYRSDVGRYLGSMQFDVTDVDGNQRRRDIHRHGTTAVQGDLPHMTSRVLTHSQLVALDRLHTARERPMGRVLGRTLDDFVLTHLVVRQVVDDEVPRRHRRGRRKKTWKVGVARDGGPGRHVVGDHVGTIRRRIQTGPGSQADREEYQTR